MLRTGASWAVIQKNIYVFGPVGSLITFAWNWIVFWRSRIEAMFQKKNYMCYSNCRLAAFHSYGESYYYCHNPWWVAIEDLEAILISVFSILTNKAKRMDKICSRWRKRLRSYIPKKERPCPSRPGSPLRWPWDRTYTPFTPCNLQCRPRPYLSTKLHSIPLLNFINLALGLSNGDLKISWNFLHADVDPKTLSYLLLSPAQQNATFAFSKRVVSLTPQPLPCHSWWARMGIPFHWNPTQRFVYYRLCRCSLDHIWLQWW